MLYIGTGNLQGFDDFTVACIMNPSSCPAGTDPDYDLGGSGPNLLPGFVGFGQKSGIYWALDREDGHALWNTMVGPGGTLGGIEWGTATDGRRIYVAISDNGKKPYTLVPEGQTITWGSWTALDATTGKLLWQRRYGPGLGERGKSSGPVSGIYVIFITSPFRRS